MGATELSAFAGVLLSVLFEYVPKLHGWYNGLDDTSQRLIMLVCLVAVAAGSVGLSCAGWLDAFSCDQVGVKDAVFALVAAVVANQSVHRVLPK